MSDRSTQNGKPDGFSTRLRQLRREKDVTQRALARLADLHYTHISRYERGVARPTIDALRRLAEALEVSPQYLMEGTDEGARVSPVQDPQLLSQFREVERLPEREREIVKTLLDAFLVRQKIRDLAS